jgi:ABC-type antimicrobial peptide transport system permease subunit
VLLGIPAVSLAVVVAALLGSVDLDPMWIASSLILAFVFLHAAYHVRRDEASRRTGMWHMLARDGDGPV